MRIKYKDLERVGFGYSYIYSSKLYPQAVSTLSIIALIGPNNNLTEVRIFERPDLETYYRYLKNVSFGLFGSQYKIFCAL